MPYFGSKLFKNIKNGFKAIGRKPLVSGVLVGAILAFAVALTPFVNANNVSFNSTRDCDSNAVINCGAMDVNELQKKYKNTPGVHKIFQYFDIGSGDINNIKQYVHAGKVTKSGNVLVGGKVVATDALTAGREDMQGSKKVTYQGVTFYTRPPKVSFKQDQLDAFVVMKNGVFDYAIIASCGNPVSAKAKHDKPEDEPKYRLQKSVRVDGGDWRENVSINYGETVEFRIIVENTGKGPVNNINVRDTLPNELIYVNGSLTKDGNTADSNLFFGTGIVVNRIAQGNRTVFRFRATTRANIQPDPCNNMNVVNRVRTTGGGLPEQNDSASVDLTCTTPQQPRYRLSKQVQRMGDRRWHEEVNVRPGTHVRYRVVVRSTGQAPARNVIVSDVLPAHVTYVNNTLLRDGNAVNANAFFGTGLNIGTLASGERTVFVFEAIVGEGEDFETCTAERLRNIANVDASDLAPLNDDAFVNKECGQPEPLVRCDVLSASSLGDRTFRFTVYYTSEHATFQNATFDFGDGTAPLLTSNTTVDHQYTADGTFTATASVTFDVNGVSQTVTGAGCRFTVSTTTPPGHCPIPGKEHLDENDPNCEESEVPGEIVNTGPGSTLAIFAGASMLGTLFYRVYAVRRMRQ